MALSWNEIKDSAIRFSKEWEKKLPKMQKQNPSGMISLIYSEYPGAKLPVLKSL